MMTGSYCSPLRASRNWEEILSMRVDFYWLLAAWDLELMVQILYQNLKALWYHVQDIIGVVWVCWYIVNIFLSVILRNAFGLHTLCNLTSSYPLGTRTHYPLTIPRNRDVTCLLMDTCFRKLILPVGFDSLCLLCPALNRCYFGWLSFPNFKWITKFQFLCINLSSWTHIPSCRVYTRSKYEDDTVLQASKQDGRLFGDLTWPTGPAVSFTWTS
jgi:hypothetical protein